MAETDGWLTMHEWDVRDVLDALAEVTEMRHEPSGRLVWVPLSRTQIKSVLVTADCRIPAMYPTVFERGCWLDLDNLEGQ